ncbi:hypothetical protein [Geobacter sp. DSM 9736]|uniref:hypothetical protein n=1 Tax=Geobacter sp. DSM 9736 TaxID=1277350 RepID=UPI000B512A42|nr:hypothetical protein [Geobacter sp. DSM 9736]SNB45218.1 hypothetical protein SAMN06269301_0621 [Geobacter sp. DSM 9736]
MNVNIISKSNVKGEVLDLLAKELPAILSGVLEIAGGKLAVLKPEQVSIAFSEASPRDVGQDIRILVLARINEHRVRAKNVHAGEILEKVVALISGSGVEYSVNVRLYFTEIGMAQHLPGAE